MSDKGKNLPFEENKTGDNLDIDIEEVWRELDAEMQPAEEMRPGDITIDMIRQRYNVSNETARKKIADLVKAGKFRRIKIAGTCLGVYRLIK